ncbi:hypothetical protein IJ00_09550 [Calothrix sp. 336/3]|nr:hypothetical protein IJ00_09550 [Calothrix sp. 336/3]
MIILPGSEAYVETLQYMPLFWKQAANEKGCAIFVCRPGSGGLLEAINQDEYIEYTEGGEYDERLQELEEIGWDDDTI